MGVFYDTATVISIVYQPRHSEYGYGEMVIASMLYM